MNVILFFGLGIIVGLKCSGVLNKVFKLLLENRSKLKFERKGKHKGLIINDDKEFIIVNYLLDPDLLEIKITPNIPGIVSRFQVYFISSYFKLEDFNLNEIIIEYVFDDYKLERTIKNKHEFINVLDIPKREVHYYENKELEEDEYV